MKQRRSAQRAVIALLTMLGASAHAADLVITNARVFTGGELIEGASVAIDGNRIEAVSRTAIDSRGARLLDAGGKTVMPGLINGHFHLFFDFYEQRYFPTSDAEAEEYAQERVRQRLAEHLEYGFTSIVSPIDMFPHVVQVRDRVNSGEWSGPRLFVAGGTLMSPGSHNVCKAVEEGARRQWCQEHMTLPVATADEAREGVRRYARGGVDFIAYDDLPTAPADIEVVTAMIEEAHRQGLRVLVHSAQAKNVNALMAAGVDAFLHPPDGSRDDYSAALPRPTKPLSVAFTLGYLEEPIRIGDATDEQRQKYAEMRTVLTDLLKAGATPVFASDMPGVPPELVVPIAGRALSGMGLNNTRILQAATEDAAKMLGQLELGTLQPGKLADVIIVDGNPVQDLMALTKVQLVIKGGKVVVDKLGSKHTFAPARKQSRAQ